MLWSLHCLWPFMQPHLVGGGYWSVSASRINSSGSQLSSFSSAADMAGRPRAAAGASIAFGCEELDNPNAHRRLGNSLWAVMVTEPGATSLKHRKLSPDPVARGIFRSRLSSVFGLAVLLHACSSNSVLLSPPAVSKGGGAKRQWVKVEFPRVLPFLLAHLLTSRLG